MEMMPEFRVLSIGEEPGVSSYRSSLIKRGETIPGVDVVTRAFNSKSTPSEIISYIQESNENERVAGILGLTPVSKEFIGEGIYDHISPHLDVDCQTKTNFEAFMRREQVPFMPTTPKAVEFLINNAPISIDDDLNVLVVGDGDTVGKPLGEIYGRKNIAHEVIETHPDLNKHWKEQIADSDANVIVGATRGAHCITADILPENTQLLVDVAYCKLPGTNKMVGNMCPEIIGIPTITSRKVGKTTTEIMYRHVLSNIK